LGLAVKPDPTPFGHDLGLAIKPDPTGFGTENKKDNTPRQHFFTKKKQRQHPSWRYSVIQSANILCLQCGPQCNESIFTINTQCFSHTF